MQSCKHKFVHKQNILFPTFRAWRKQEDAKYYEARCYDIADAEVDAEEPGKLQI